MRMMKRVSYQNAICLWFFIGGASNLVVLLLLHGLQRNSLCLFVFTFKGHSLSSRISEVRNFPTAAKIYARKAKKKCPNVFNPQRENIVWRNFSQPFSASCSGSRLVLYLGPTLFFGPQINTIIMLCTKN